MTEEQMIAWIDNASYYDLLRKWRFAKAGDPYFQGEVGTHYTEVMAAKKKEIGDEEHSRISKEIGWNR
jgi:hypothetical protein